MKWRTITLTTAIDTVIGTSGNDTINGEAGTVQDGDIIIDQTTTDNDVANLVLTTAYTPSNITKIENINIDWDAFGAASVNAAGITGAEGGSAITLTSSKTGFLGNATVSNTGENNVTAGSGMVGTLTVTGVEDSTIDAGVATKVVVTGAASTDDSATITAGAATTSVTTTATETVEVTASAATTTVSVTGYDSATVDASAAPADATVTLNDNDASATATLTLGADATVNTAAAVGTVTLNAVDGSTVEVSQVGNLAELIVAGDGDVTVETSNLKGATVTNSKDSGSLTVETDETGAVDYSDVDADTIRLTGAVNNTVTAASGANFAVAEDLNAGVFEVDTDTDNDSITVTVSVDQTDGSTTFTNFETVNLVAAGTAGEGTDLTFAALAAADANNDATINLSGTNDVEIQDLEVETLDASQLDGELIVTTSNNSANITVAGAVGDNDVTFHPSAVESVFVGQGGDDSVDYGTLGGDAKATAVTGAGNDTITADVGSMNNADGYLNVEAGAGDDTVVLSGAPENNAANIVLAFGDGDDTLELANTTDLTGADVNLTITGLETLQIEDDGAATLAASQIDGESWAVRSNGFDFANPALTVALADGGDSVDLSGLNASDSATTGAAIAIVGGDGDDTITGTSLADTITGGDGADVLTGGAGADTFAYAATNFALMTAEGEDTINDFVDGSDVIQFASGLLVAADGGDFTDGNASVQEVADGAVKSALFADTGDAAILFVADFAGSADNATAVAGVAAAGSWDDSAAVVIAVTDGTDMYLWLTEAGAGATLEGDELQLIAVLNNVNDLAAGGDSFAIA